MTLALERAAHAGAIAAVIGISLVWATGCVVVHEHPTPPRKVVRASGPPPHAPAHGYRHKHADGTELVFDDRLGVYVALGLVDVYHDGVRYYRFRESGWELSPRLDGAWVHVSSYELPAGLRSLEIRRRGHGNYRKHYPAHKN